MKICQDKRKSGHCGTLKNLSEMKSILLTCTSVRPVAAFTSGGNGEVDAGAEGKSFSDDPACREVCTLWLLSILGSTRAKVRGCFRCN